MRAVPPSNAAPVLQRLVLLVLVLAVAVVLDAAVPATSRPAEGFTAVAPTTATPAPLSLATVDQLVFSNQYEKAADAYRTIVTVRPGDPTAHSAYALFLTYQGRLDAALSEARRGVDLAPDDGRARAILCRALDWNAKFEDAVTAGRRAVQQASDDALAHLFLAEALADHGDYDQSRAEIATARGLVGPASPPYERAEVHREEANLDRDLGERLGQIGALRTAELAQPQWVERVTELASALFDDGDLDQAHAEFVKALGLRDDASMLLSLGFEALQAGDDDDAATAFGRARQITPDDPAVLHGLAEVAMSRDHDPDTAAADLAMALQQDATDYNAAAYLLFLARDVWRDEQRGLSLIDQALAGSHGVRPSRRGAALDVDAVLRSHAQRALEAVNRIRQQAGLQPVRLDDRLSGSAAAHSWYWLFNQALPSQKGLGIHGETPDTPGFSGVRPLDRAQTFHWRDGPVGEDITHRGSPEAAVGDWLDSVYHRFPILRPDLQAIGYADAVMASLPIEDMEFGFGYPTGARAQPVLYPADAQAGVPARFFDNELPDPVPAGGPRVTGYPVTVNFDIFSHARLVSFTLSGPDGKPLNPVYVLGPSVATENCASLLPASPLVAGRRYAAHIVAVVDDHTYDRTWSFTVAG